MILNAHGSIFDSGAQALVNPVNCVGYSGAGLAKQFRDHFFFFYEQYRTAAFAGEIKRGKIYVYTLESRNRRWILAFPTKDHWKDRSQYRDIETGLEDLVRVIRDLGIHSIAIPALGCGLGGLRWEIVKPMIEKTMEPLSNVNVLIYPPVETPANASNQKTTHQ